MEKLIEFLKVLGIDLHDGESKTVIFKDAIIHAYTDDKGDSRIDVSPVSKLHLATAESIENFLDLDVLRGFAKEDIDLDDEELVTKFLIGDKVTVDGYTGQVFEVIGISRKFMYDEFGERDTETIYDIIDVDTGEYKEAFEEDMVQFTSQQAKLLVGGQLKKIVDDLLDEYNDVMELYKAFGDEEYKQRADVIMEELKKIKL